MLFDLVTVLDGSSHDLVPVITHLMSQQIHRGMQIEPGSSSRDGQQIRVDPPDHVVIPCDSEVPREGSEIEGDDDNPIFNVFQVKFPMNTPLLNLNCNHPNPLSHSYHVHEDESHLNSLKEMCVRDSQPPVFLLFLQVKQHVHSVRVAWNLLVCRQNN